MNKNIVNNLFELWTYIGKKTNKLIETEEYKSVSITNTDWPNRVYAISSIDNTLSNIIELSQKDLLPDKLTISATNGLEHHPQLKLIVKLKNMAFNLKNLKTKFETTDFIKQVKTKTDAFHFAKTASESFGYHVDGEVVYSIIENLSKVKIFNFLKDGNYLGCGMVFFDSNNNAGFHMIGTIPRGRGQGIGTKITERLILEAVNKQCENCVLHASLMGETIYKKLGFTSFDELVTYRILKSTK